MRLDDLKIGEIISRTRYSNVLNGTYKLNNIQYPVVIKRVKNNHDFQSYEKEINALLDIQDKGIVKLLGYNEIKQEFYFEPAGEEDFEDYILTRPKVCYCKIMKTLVSMTETINKVHKPKKFTGYVHGDISSYQWLFKDEGDPILVDFGTAYRKDEIPDECFHTVYGTDPFIAPEKYDAKGEFGIQSDTFAMGVLAYFAFAKKYPFETKSKNLEKAVKTLKPKELHLPHQNVETVILGMLEKNPKDRATICELESELKSVIY